MVKKIQVWSYDLDGHCSGVGWMTLKEAKIEGKRRRSQSRNLKDDNAEEI